MVIAWHMPWHACNGAHILRHSGCVPEYLRRGLGYALVPTGMAWDTPRAIPALVQASTTLGATAMTHPTDSSDLSDYRLQVVAGCDMGPCPKVGRRPARPGNWVVQGLRIRDAGERAALGEIPGHEDVVEIPDAVAIEFARRLRDEGLI